MKNPLYPFVITQQPDVNPSDRRIVNEPGTHYLLTSCYRTHTDALAALAKLVPADAEVHTQFPHLDFEARAAVYGNYRIERREWNDRAGFTLES